MSATGVDTQCGDSISRALESVAEAEGGSHQPCSANGDGAQDWGGDSWNKISGFRVFLPNTYVGKALNAEQTGKAKAPWNRPQKQ